MFKEFEGKTEQEAIDQAIDDLGIDREEFDVEIVETSKKGLIFKKGLVKIRVHIADEDLEDGYPAYEKEETVPEETDRQPGTVGEFPPEAVDVVRFVETTIQKMGYPGRIFAEKTEEAKIVLKIESAYSGILIGKGGKNLDALQLLANVYTGKLGLNFRIIIDAEGYRRRREEALKRMAKKTADQVRKNRGSRLLEPMNPFERRLVHTALTNMKDIDTKSEGEGLYKQVRIIYRSKPH
jgi:spoIIIJ-associated protein